MKILIVFNGAPSKQLPFSGIFVENQYKKLNELSQNHDIIDHFFIKRKSTGWLGSFFKYFFAFIRFIPFCFNRYDIIHLHYFYPLIVFVFLYKLMHNDSEIVATFHGSDINVDINTRFKEVIFGYLAKKIDYAIAVGKDLAFSGEEKLNIKIGSVLCAGIDKTIFYKMNNIEKLYDFIFVGTFNAHKGIDVLLEAIEQLDNSEVKFCFVGFGTMFKDIEKLSQKYDITIKKNQSHQQLRKLYNQSKFLLLPSKYEGFGLVISESLFCGTPVIASKVGGTKEQIVDGYNGFFLKNITSDEIVKKIQQAVNIKKKEYNYLVSNTKNVNKKYTLNYVCTELMRIYSELQSNHACVPKRTTACRNKHILKNHS